MFCCETRLAEITEQISMKRSSPSFLQESHWTKATKRTIGKDFAGRNVAVFSDDLFIVSYPRSGSTWLRFLIGSLIREGPVTIQNIEQVIPDIHVNSSRFLISIPRPRLMKSHEYFDRHPGLGWHADCAAFRPGL